MSRNKSLVLLYRPETKAKSVCSVFFFRQCYMIHHVQFTPKMFGFPKYSGCFTVKLIYRQPVNNGPTCKRLSVWIRHRFTQWLLMDVLLNNSIDADQSPGCYHNAPEYLETFWPPFMSILRESVNYYPNVILSCAMTPAQYAPCTQIDPGY